MTVWLDYFFRLMRRLARIFSFLIVSLSKFVVYPLILAVAILVFGFLTNALFHSRRDVAYRDLSPYSPICLDTGTKGWDALARIPKIRPKAYRGPEAKLERSGGIWRARLRCSIQRHAIPEYRSGQESVTLFYDLAFVEFKEDGRPYLIRDEEGQTVQTDNEFVRVRDDQGPSEQLDAVLHSLRPGGKHFVIAFVHGWRHDASVGDDNVQNLRVYAAYAARALVDRCRNGDERYCDMRVTALYLGWRGARADEIHLIQKYGLIGQGVANFSALFTLFDRKPVSETVSAAVVSSLRAVQGRLLMNVNTEDIVGIPPSNPNRMIVIGHSLGGNSLMVGLKDQILKDIALHRSDTYMRAPLGDLTVLINPASEASNWTAIQKAVWQRFPMVRSERAYTHQYEEGFRFFRQGQRPTLISVTSARDWPPGGLRERDCSVLRPAAPAPGAEPEASGADAASRYEESRKAATIVDYDAATYDAFPFFKGDFRPIAGSLPRWAAYLSGNGSSDICNPNGHRSLLQRAATGIAAVLRVLPFTNSDIENTRTIGHLDPPRPPRGALSDALFTSRPFGTTHEMLSRESPAKYTSNTLSSSTTIGAAQNQKRVAESEAPALAYEQIQTTAPCFSAKGWLDQARGTDLQSGYLWDSDYPPHHRSAATYKLTKNLPALRILHGFNNAGLAPITRANDPFWNVRAFDTALARHNGYMLPTFICTLYQLVLDDPTTYIVASAGKKT